jgi:serine/threonine-protein kinase
MPYALHGLIAAGGMGAVHFGRIAGPSGFAKTVAIKKLHPQHAKDERFVTMFLNEARLAARVRHPNVVQTLDVVVEGDDVLVVMEYVQGVSLAKLGPPARPPLPIVLAIISNVLAGLHAAHEAGIVHRDVSPQNVMIDAGGIARVLDFGIARAVEATQTSGNTLDGKLAYMAPEQVTPGARVSMRADVYSAGVVLWELSVGKRLFEVEDRGQLYFLVANAAIRPPRTVREDVPEALAAVIAKALSKDPDARFASPLEMADALRECGPIATPLEVAAYLRSVAGPALEAQREALARVERDAPLEAAPRASPRRTRLVPLAAAASLVLVAAIALVWRRSPPSPVTASEAIVPPPAVSTIVASAPSPSPSPPPAQASQPVRKAEPANPRARVPAKKSVLGEGGLIEHWD